MIKLNFLTILDIIEKFATIIAIIVGGAWVYFNAIRGRTFIPRLVPKISGQLLANDDKQFLLVSLQIENVGSSIAKIHEKGTGLIVSFQDTLGDGKEAVTLSSDKLMAFSVFDLENDEERKIEPGTTIYSQELIEVPKDMYYAFRMVFRVSSPSIFWFNKVRRKWRAIAVVTENMT